LQHGVYYIIIMHSGQVEHVTKRVDGVVSARMNLRKVSALFLKKEDFLNHIYVPVQELSAVLRRLAPGVDFKLSVLGLATYSDSVRS